MSQSVLLQTALCLPAPDIEALIQGRIIAAMPQNFINPGLQFALYPANISIDLLSSERYYRSGFLPIAQKVFANLSSETVVIKAWAKCEGCKMYLPESFEALSQLTVWTKEALQQALRQRPHIFLAYLRVYHLLEPHEVPVQPQSRQFVPLPNSLTISNTHPVLTDHIFTIRKHQLEKLEPPPHPELEEFQNALSSLAITNPGYQQLEHDIKVFLGWSNHKLTQQPNQNLTWINDITKLGDRSIELEEKKSNYQAGTDFENITRRSLEFLGFKVESDYKGGAGGLDLFCSQPYPLVCECKAGKSIPDRTVEELDRIGKRHLQENYMTAVRLIIGPGQPTKQLKESAKISRISIINAMTLQKLVELKAKYPGAVNLFELKPYLEQGQIDSRIEEYINQVEKQIALRSQLVEQVKKYLENTGFERASVDALHGFIAGASIKIKPQELHEILIELSSPLTGYLGRIQGENWRSDRFYFLRDF